VKKITDSIYRFTRVYSSNAYLVVSGNALALIDCGMRGEAWRISAEMKGAGFDLVRIRMVLLTHAHPDHDGNAAWLAGNYGARILAHREDVPYLEGVEKLPARTWLDEWIYRLAPGRTPVKVDRALDEGDVVEVMGGLRVIHAPGHTPGSACFYQPQQGVLFCGDALGRKRDRDGSLMLTEPPPEFTLDLEAAARSAHKLIGIPVRFYCPGHGRPLVRRGDGRLRPF